MGGRFVQSSTAVLVPSPSFIGCCAPISLRIADRLFCSIGQASVAVTQPQNRSSDHKGAIIGGVIGGALFRYHYYYHSY